MEVVESFRSLRFNSSTTQCLERKNTLVCKSCLFDQRKNLFQRPAARLRRPLTTTAPTKALKLTRARASLQNEWVTVPVVCFSTFLSLFAAQKFLHLAQKRHTGRRVRRCSSKQTPQQRSNKYSKRWLSSHTYSHAHTWLTDRLHIHRLSAC